MSFEGPNLNKPREKPDKETEKKPGDLAVEHIGNELASIETKLGRDKIWGKVAETIGGTGVLLGLTLLIFKTVGPGQLELSSGFQDIISPENLKNLIPLGSGLMGLIAGSKMVKSAILEATKKKAELLRPYLNLPK